MALELDIERTSRTIDKVGEVDATVLIGGRDDVISDFVPNVNASFRLSSDRERYFLNLNRRDRIAPEGTRATEEDGVLRATYNGQTDIYKFDGSTLMADVEFFQHPGAAALNISHDGTKYFWDYDIQCSPDLTFERIPFDESELDQTTEISRNTTIPDKFRGGYTLHCPHQHHFKRADGSTVVNYRSGKVADVERPKFKDSARGEQWGFVDLIETRDGKILRVSVDKAWFDSSTFPTTLDPNVGFDSIGTLDTNISHYEWIWGQGGSIGPWVSPGDYDVTSIFQYQRDFGGNDDFKIGLRGHTAGSPITPGTSIANAYQGFLTTGAADSWREAIPTGCTLSNGEKFYLSCANSSSSGDLGLKYDAISAGAERSYYGTNTSSTYSSFMYDGGIVWGAFGVNIKVSAYAVLQAVSSGVAERKFPRGLCRGLGRGRA